MLNSQLPKTQRLVIPRVASLSELEEIVLQLGLSLSLRGKTAEEIAAMLHEHGVGEEEAKEAAKAYAKAGAAGLAIPVLIRFMGKRFVKQLVEKLAVAIVTKVLGREGAEAFAKRVLVQVTERTLSAWLGFIAILWTALDVTLFVTSPARRIIVPTVILISAMRVRKSLDDNEPK
jgi:uncharacterized protein YaaW (UPF0174 family)